MTIPVGLVGGVKGQVGDVGGVQAGKAFHLVCKATVLIPSLHQLPPNFMKSLMVLFQQLTVPLPHLDAINGAS